MRRFGRWLFGVPASRKAALALLIFFPGLRRRLRIYVGVEGGMPEASHDPYDVSEQALRILPERVAAIHADLEEARRKFRK